MSTTSAFDFRFFLAFVITSSFWCGARPLRLKAGATVLNLIPMTGQLLNDMQRPTARSK
jgi:hypothetical protein